ncbi:GNAT family N-acetyltransferase [Baekduia sp.]|uniref:GNAT family N-acetyltransferase n=1 Tax=Baekduia sp. TaxID=2600305 RepID=UPI002E032540|nr:GNAT family N-acetyltransferase [Baekduia sp.]
MRAARPEEAEAVGALVEAAFSRHVAAVGRRPAPMDDDHAARIAAGQQYVVDGDGPGTLAASIVLVKDDGFLVVNNVAVAPDCQRQGHGRALLTFAEDEARRRGLPEVRLHTHARMADNLIMYPRLGYVEAGRENQGGFDRVLFVKTV